MTLPNTPDHRSTALAVFVTPHGFGHATRAAALMEALHARLPGLRFEVFTETPAWVFADSTRAPFGYHALLTDLGLAQATPLTADLPETLRRLETLLPFDPALVARLAEQVKALGCVAVLCDIAALGIAVAQAAGLPSVLVENFTWDWIYEAYADEAPGLRPHIAYLQEQYANATLHIQTAPICNPQGRAIPIVPVSRAGRSHRAAVREMLGLAPEEPAILLTMGGMGTQWESIIEQAQHVRDIHFIIPGGSADGVQRRGNVTLIPHRSPVFHPDLLGACDAVLGKLGYSTLAEAYYAGLPYAFVERPGFREYPVLRDFIQAEMGGLEIGAAAFARG
ncbi:MAG: hypothetical protein RMK99_12070, partial [Anaerolineales bacterium]|nr:hypothetical protein [Anaerolineales bacterium]